MAIEVIVPRLGWSMDEGTFGEWLKRDGDVIERGQALFVLEGEKSAQDIESFDAGILRIPPNAPQAGDTVKVGQVLAFLVAEGEAVPFEAAGTGPVAKMKARVEIDSAAPTTEVIRDGATKSTPPRDRATASPRARRLAAELGVDWEALQGTGRGGRIREQDIVQFANSQTGAAPSKPAAATPTVRGAAGSMPVSRMRKTIAARMSAGVHEAAPVTLTTRCDATNLVNLRGQFRSAAATGETAPDYNALFVKLTAAVLVRHPGMTRQWGNGEMTIPEGMHLAVAVDIEEGLVAPVIRDVHRLSLRQVAVELRRLIDAARDGSLSENELQGGVFTVTNLGMYGIDAFTPIINLPQSAILGVGRISREPAVVGNAIVPRDQVTLSLTFDHRVVDGAPAARFLNDLRLAFEQPGPGLVS
jgi:pyruvate dehydrogenase E2 component (dihydrolipoamide acetyltransferase)